jgi:hypothetical protein
MSSVVPSITSKNVYLNLALLLTKNFIINTNIGHGIFMDFIEETIWERNLSITNATISMGFKTRTL